MGNRTAVEPHPMHCIYPAPRRRPPYSTRFHLNRTAGARSGGTGSPTVHRGNTSEVSRNQPRVRFDGVNSRVGLPECRVGTAGGI
jgi:hypothetical protein